ncbi:lysophospholipid acyltransferase family protein [Lachnoclostridium phytofermentans]|uniref:Phospholipid/glycerol acyltransferase n=1 Tax=Lachnoclostridium phytofermentans (strain ATCC 700394 / DSM 18823 / ISDg) TaxID=357809 RepID=A9KHM4_LACP7|nr:lysophospholipid acyltransferase family protein [Lachnoclostridium phytofermentans]ABX42309.1 phospholipid/glycerol acyltransferase [Lachnoclostridium phytofermentans ISDg]
MNKLLLRFVKLLPEHLITKFVKFYVNSQMKKHVSLDVKGLENLDSDLKRPYLFVCNHLSNSDGLVLNKVLEKENIIFVAGKKLESNSLTALGFKIVRSISILPNSPDKDAIKKVISAVKEGNSILIFPEGTRSRTAKMIEGKKGILLFAKLTNAPIVPIGIWGTEKFMPIEEDMGKEAFNDANININIGEVFNLPKKSEDETKGNWEANCLNHIMVSISELLPREYRGFYADKNK